jgi:TPR repeat protein
VAAKICREEQRLAPYPLGVLYFAGDGVTEDVKAAAEWWQKGAEAGDWNAQYATGALYENGLVVERDLAKAHSLYEKSVAQNYDPAKSALRRVERNEDAPANPELALAIKCIQRQELLACGEQAHQARQPRCR